MFQGFVLALAVGHFAGGAQPVRYAFWGAVAFPVVSWLLAKFAPRMSVVFWALMVTLWAGIGGYGAFQDPSLQAWEWTLVFTVGGLVFGACANYPLLNFPEPRTSASDPHGISERESPALRAPSEDADPWAVLGLPRNASESQIKRAYFTRMQQFHPGEAGTAELRSLAEDALAQVKWAYDELRREHA